MLRLNIPELRLLPEGRVIKAAEYACLVEVETILALARAEAEEIRAAARSAFEAEKERGYRDGLEQGKAQISEQMVDTVANAVHYLGTVECKLVDVVVHAVERILGAAEKDELIVKVVRRALDLVRSQKQVTIRVAPADADPVRREVESILAGFPGVSFLDVIPDNRLDRGGCILESELGVVDASIDVQLQAIRQALARSVKGGIA